MKRSIQWFAMIMILPLLTACSIARDVDKSINYTDEASQYVNEAVTFVNQLPALAKEAANNADAKESLTEQLDKMKQRITEFNQLEAPSFAGDIHEKLKGYNETLSTQIDQYKEQVKKGVTDLKNTELSDTLKDLENTLEEVRNLKP